MRTVHDNRLFVVSYPEVIGLFVAFAATLFFLYPRQTLEQQVLAEQSNYDLTEAYLENMLKHDPANESMMLALAKTSYKIGKIGLAAHLTAILEHTSNPKIHNDALEIRYLVYKQQALQTSKNSRLSTVQQKHLIALLQQIAAKKETMSAEALDRWYSEAYALEQYSVALHFTDLAVQKTPDNPVWLERCVDVATALRITDKALSCIDTLIHLQPDKQMRWLSKRYRLLLVKNYSAAKATLEELIRQDSSWGKEVPILELYWKHYEAAAAYYEKRAKTTMELKAKTALLMKAISALQQGMLLNKAVLLAKQYETLALDDPKSSTFWLRLYLAAGDANAAAALSSKLLHRRNEAQ